MSRVLVTGGAGYIGSHAAKALRLAGHEPITIDNLVYGHKWAVKWGPFYQGDIRNRDFVVDVIQREKIDAIMHFAAYAYVGESVRDPLKYYDNNFGGTVSLLAAVEKTGVRNFVFSSTCATYGIPESTPIAETAPQNPINPYGRTKLMIERVLQDCAKSFGLRSVALRYFNAAGADPDLEIGELHDPETHLIPLVVQATDPSGPELSVFGTDYSTPDGTCVRDYIHVTDLADAHVKALQLTAAQSEPCLEGINLGTGIGVSVREMITAVESATGKKVRFKEAARRPGDPPVLVADGSKARRLLGWRPALSDLATIVKTAAQWHNKVARQS